jgi:alpha-1,2-mannosyltransferase
VLEQTNLPVVPRGSLAPGLSGIPQTIPVPPRSSLPASPVPSSSVSSSSGPRWTNGRIAAAGVLAAAVVIGLFLGPWGPRMVDLSVYRLGASTLLHGGDIYSVVLPGPELAFTYTSFAAILFAPFALVPTVVAHVAVLVVSLVGLWVILELTVRALGVQRSLAWSVPLALVAISAHPVFQTLQFGQINLVIAALVLADVLPRRRGRFRGVMVGIAAGIKLVPGAFIVYFLVTGQRRAAMVSALTAAGSVALGFTVAPTASWQYWTKYAFDADRAGGIAYVTNQSILGITARLLRDPHPPRALTLSLSAVVIAGAILIARRLQQRGDRLAAVSTVAVGALLASPISWSHHWVWFIPCAAAMLPWAGRSRWHWAALITGTAIIWTGPMQYMPNTQLRELHHTLPQQIVANIYGPVALAFLVWAAIRAWAPARRTADGTLTAGWTSVRRRQGTAPRRTPGPRASPRRSWSARPTRSSRWRWARSRTDRARPRSAWSRW